MKKVLFLLVFAALRLVVSPIEVCAAQDVTSSMQKPLKAVRTVRNASRITDAATSQRVARVMQKSASPRIRYGNAVPSVPGTSSVQTGSVRLRIPSLSKLPLLLPAKVGMGREVVGTYLQNDLPALAPLPSVAEPELSPDGDELLEKVRNELRMKILRLRERLNAIDVQNDITVITMITFESTTTDYAA